MTFNLESLEYVLENSLYMLKMFKRLAAVETERDALSSQLADLKAQQENFSAKMNETKNPRDNFSNKIAAAKTPRDKFSRAGFSKILPR